MVSRQAIQSRLRHAGDFTDAQWQAMLGQYGNRCYYCHEAGLILLPEHRTPLSRGGQHTADNIVPACRPCNTRKSDMTEAEYAAYRDRPRTPQLTEELSSDMLTTTQAASRIGCSTKHVQHLVLTGSLPARRVGERLYLLPIAAVDAYAAVEMQRGWRRGRARKDEVARTSQTARGKA